MINIKNNTIIIRIYKDIGGYGLLIMLGTGSAIEEQCLFPYDNSCFVRELDKLKLYISYRLWHSL